MPDQPPDPIHYDMRIPPQPKDAEEEERHRAKKHGGKINTESGAADTGVNRKDEASDSQLGS